MLCKHTVEGRAVDAEIFREFGGLGAWIQTNLPRDTARRKAQGGRRIQRATSTSFQQILYRYKSIKISVAFNGLGKFSFVNKCRANGNRFGMRQAGNLLGNLIHDITPDVTLALDLNYIPKPFGLNQQINLTSFTLLKTFSTTPDANQSSTNLRLKQAFCRY